MPHRSPKIRAYQNLRRARALVRQVCLLAGQVTYIDDLQHEAEVAGLVAAVDRHDKAPIFNWLIRMLNFQGVSDAVADGYLHRYGAVTWNDVEQLLADDPDCGKLIGYWAFADCRYHKTAQTCSNPSKFATCPLPRHPFRNGRLNQTAFSLFLFIRDIAAGDIVSWIDDQIAAHRRDGPAACAALLDPLRNVYGASDKVMGMALAGLLMGAGSTRPGWFETGANFIVVDTLVHNFLHRTGILHRFGADHLYGPICYGDGGCAGILNRIAAGIDARRFNPAFPKVFPRYVQHAIWRYCAQPCFDICNGNQIDDRGRCTNMWCRLYGRCDRRALRGKPKKPQN